MKKFLICVCLIFCTVFCFAEEKKEYKNAIGISMSSTGHLESSTIGLCYRRDITKTVSIESNVLFFYITPIIDDIHLFMYNADLQLNYYLFDYVTGNMLTRFYTYGHAGTDGLIAADFGNYLQYEVALYSGIGVGTDMNITKCFSIPVEFGLLCQYNVNREKAFFIGPEASLGFMLKF